MARVGVFEREISVDGVVAKQVAHHFLHDIHLHVRGIGGVSGAAGQCHDRQTHPTGEMHI